MDVKGYNPASSVPDTTPDLARYTLNELLQIKVSIDSLVQEAMSGSVDPYIHLSLTTAQDHGGVNNTVQTINWDGTSLLTDDTYFTHDPAGANPSQITVVEAGTYRAQWNLGWDTAGANRTTLTSRMLIDGVTVLTRGSRRAYCRGLAYGDAAVHYNSLLYLTAGQVIECQTIVEDSDGTYVSNSIPAESEFIITKVR